MSSSGVNLEKYLIPLDEIHRATEKFSVKRYIGGGGFGAVYRGQLSKRWEERTVAVKRLSPDSHQGESEFRNEIGLISKFHHGNIIAFIGYCNEGGEMIIVYEYALNGSLDHHLQHPNKMKCITWAQRLKICIGAAEGLHYLHSGLGEHDRVIHRDVKSANILLDGNMVAKICDFGLSKLGTRNQPDTQIYTKVAGTQFYLDPTYHESGILRKESDVYSFGVVLFEVVSGMLVYGERCIGDEQLSLMHTVRRYYEKEPEMVIDPYIKDQIKSFSFDRFKDIAYQCISFNSWERPTLDTVIERLQEALNIQISEHSSSIPADSYRIESLIGKLNSTNPYNQRMASHKISLLIKEFNETHADFAKAIPGLTHLLTAPDSVTQEQAVTALYNLSHYEDNRGILILSGAVPGLVHLLEKGSIVAREDAVATIWNISETAGADKTIGQAGGIPPLVKLLSEGTTTVKKNAAKSLETLCINDDNSRMAVSAGAVPILMELLTEPQGVFETVKLIRRLSCVPEGMSAIAEAEGVRHLAEAIGSGWESDDCQPYAVEVLVNLCSKDDKYLVEAQEHGVMEKLKDVGPDAGYWPNKNVEDLRRILILSGAVPGLVHLLEKGSIVAREDAVATIWNISETAGADKTIGQAGGIPPLVKLLSEGTTTVKKNAAKSLETLCINDDNSRMAVRAGAVPILMELLTEPQGVFETVKLIRRLSWVPEGMSAIAEAEGVRHLAEAIGSGWESDDCQPYAVEVLVNLCSKDDKYLVEAQEHGVMEKLKDVGPDAGYWPNKNVEDLRRMIKTHKLIYTDTEDLLMSDGSDIEDLVIDGSDTEVVMFEPDTTDSWLVAIAKRGALQICLICDKITKHSCIR